MTEIDLALGYPYEPPGCSYVYTAERALPLTSFDAGSDGWGEPRLPVVAYGANCAHSALARKFCRPDAPEDCVIPVVTATLHDFDVVYSAHVSPYGAIPGTLRACPGCSVRVAVTFLTAPQAEHMDRTELNYVRTPLEDARLELDGCAPAAAPSAYLSRHGSLDLGEGEVALAAIPAAGRRLPALTEPEVLALVHRLLAPEEPFESFVLAGARDPALRAERTRRLHALARAA